MIELGLAASLLITIGGGVFLSVGGFFAIKQKKHDASKERFKSHIVTTRPLVILSIASDINELGLYHWIGDP